MENNILKLMKDIELRKNFQINSQIDLEKFNLEEVTLKWIKILNDL